MAESPKHFEIVSINNEPINEPPNTPKKRRKDNTAARRMRLYRQRLRGEVISDPNPDDLPLKRPRAMTGAERIRLYRLRKKLAQENLLKDNEYVVLTNQTTNGHPIETSLGHREQMDEAGIHQLSNSENEDNSSNNSKVPEHIKEEVDIGEIFLIDGSRIKSEIKEEESLEPCNDQFKNDMSRTDANNDFLDIKEEKLNDYDEYGNDINSTDSGDNCLDPDINVKKEDMDDNDQYTNSEIKEDIGIDKEDNFLDPEASVAESGQNSECFYLNETAKPIAVKVEPEIEEKILPTVDSVKLEQFPSEIQFVAVKEETLENCSIPSYDVEHNWGEVHEEVDSMHETCIPEIFVKKENQENSNEAKCENNANSSSEKIECEFCDYTGDSQSNIKHHMGTVHHNYAKNYNCEYCDHTTTTAAYLKRHISAVHHKTKNHKCEYCNHATNASADLTKHVNAVHHKMKNYKCHYCDYRASRASNVQLHIDSVHHKIKNYRCGHCNYTASTAWSLKTHIFRHTNIDNNKCELCNFTASNVSTIKRHISSVHLKIKK